MGAVHKHLTLLLLHTGGKVVLGMKKRGFGQGKLNGFGGKIDPYETPLAAAIREMQEESGVTVKDAAHIGDLLFTFVGSNELLQVYVFRATRYEGDVIETEEMAPQWFLDTEPPLDRMWADDAYWLPLALAGKRFTGRFDFDGHSTIVRHDLRELGPGEPLCLDAATATPVTVKQGAITS